MTGALRVVSRGMLSQIQDAGRRGYQKFGVPVSGAMDAEALYLGNRLVGNPTDAAAIEVTLGGAEFMFLQPTVIAVTGGDLGATLDGSPVPLWQSVSASETSSLKFALPPVRGLRAYLCVAGGIATRVVLGSRSTHAASKLGGVRGLRLEHGDQLPFGQASADAVPGLAIHEKRQPHYQADLRLRVIPGPQDAAFTESALKTFFSAEYQISDKSDRQGARLEGPKLESKSGRYDIVSDAVVPGSIQVPGDGKPIILLADRQPTGGYTKIGVVATVDLPQLAQAQPGARVRFTRASVEDAQKLLSRRRKELAETRLEMAGGSPEYSFKVNGSTVRVTVAGAAQASIPGVVLVEVGGDQLPVEIAPV